jgi:predicted DNA-binding antitoxin AbrB/MazE fold protein
MMTKQFEAVYQGGLLRPLQPVGLLEDQKVIVTIALAPVALHEADYFDFELQRDCAQHADESLTLEQVRGELASLPDSLADDIIAEREERF